MAITENRIPTSDLPNVGRGFLMGGADIVPGVSGGTVALILGIYERLVAAINHVDRTFLQQILKGQYRQAALHIDLRFLVALGAGIACGIISLASLMHYLLEHHRTFTLAAFFGMILASSLIVFRNIQVDSGSHRWRCVLIGVAGIVLAFAVGLVLYAMSDRIVFFNSPSDLVANTLPSGSRIRLGGVVEVGSVSKRDDGNVIFSVTDGAATVQVAYRGILPDLFSEGQGVVTEGLVGGDGVFTADTVFAKHDEEYMPREVVDSLKEQGVWQHDDPAAGQ